MKPTLFLRPTHGQTTDLLPLSLSGNFPNGATGAPYEGRININNAVGSCTVKKIAGDALPPGHELYVQDNQVVLSWPMYETAAAPITNPLFEDGMNGWSAGAGWVSSTDNPIEGARSAMYGKGYWGSSILSSESRYPVTADVPVTAQCRVRQGASSAGNAGAGVRVEWRNAAGEVVSFKDGNMVMQGEDNEVKTSSVNAGFPPPGAATVNIACHGLRKRQNRNIWADQFEWDYEIPAVGINTPGNICFTLEVTDAMGRTAYWTGCINVSNVIIVISSVSTITTYPETTTHQVDLPPAPVGSMYLVGIALRMTTGSFNIPTLITPPGWTVVISHVTGNSPPRSRSYWIKKMVDGSEGDQLTINLDVANGPGSMGAVAYAIMNTTGQTDATSITGTTSANPNPPALSPGWAGEDTLYVAGLMTNNTSFPTVWSLPDNQEAGWATDGIVRQVASTIVADGAALDPPAYTTAGAANWGCATIAVRST